MSDDVYKIIIDINKSVGRIEAQLECMRDTDEICRKAADQAEEALGRVKEIVDGAKWIFRAIMGAVITTVVSALSYFLH